MSLVNELSTLADSITVSDSQPSPSCLEDTTWDGPQDRDRVPLCVSYLNRSDREPGAEPGIESEKFLHESNLFGEPLDESLDAADRPGDSIMAEEITARPCRTVVYPDILLPDEEYGSVETADSTVLPKSVRAKTYVETTTKNEAEVRVQRKPNNKRRKTNISRVITVTTTTVITVESDESDTG